MAAIYDHTGRVVSWRDDETIYDMTGRARVFLNDEHEVAYSYSDGTVLGWFVGGNYRDRTGRVVGWESDASGGPAKPARQARPAISPSWSTSGWDTWLQGA